ncbi:uncharacterized protein J3D65DRAFT_58415 [Phyllosticta citribraziliensis]|uniref:Transmembrane protein n=1 Tax=Phyllosticta citribraziliensis TaxID=989973 RepID=A0ABR1LCA6_9PEZI
MGHGESATASLPTCLGEKDEARRAHALPALPPSVHHRSVCLFLVSLLASALVSAPPLPQTAPLLLSCYDEWLPTTGLRRLPVWLCLFLMPCVGLVRSWADSWTGHDWRGGGLENNCDVSLTTRSICITRAAASRAVESLPWRVESSRITERSNKQAIVLFRRVSKGRSATTARRLRTGQTALPESASPRRHSAPKTTLERRGGLSKERGIQTGWPKGVQCWALCFGVAKRRIFPASVSSLGDLERGQTCLCCKRKKWRKRTSRAKTRGGQERCSVLVPGRRRAATPCAVWGPRVWA